MPAYPAASPVQSPDLDRMPPSSPFRLAQVVLLAALVACSAVPPRPAPTEAAAGTAAAGSRTPDLAYPVLFATVQGARLFDDQKTFADARPLRDPAAIHADFLQRRNLPGFDLRRFVGANFDVPATPRVEPVRVGPTLSSHIDGLWPHLTRTDGPALPHDSLLALPHPYVVPGGRFRELYYWDSYFTMLGLVESGQPQRMRDMVANFAWLIDRHGHIPNGTRTYYLSRSQPPFFSHMVELQAQLDGAAAYRRYLPQLRREHAWWMRGERSLARGQATLRVVRLDDGSVLNRYWDERDTPRPEAWRHDMRTAAAAVGRAAPEVFRDLRAGAESGWDYSSRWLDDGRTLATIRTTAFVPVDLNSLLHHLEATIAHACREDAQPQCAREFEERAARRRIAIEAHLWSEAGFYADYDFERGVTRAHLTAATLFPLFTGIASAPRAKRTAAIVRARLLQPGGLMATTLDTGEQWDAPNAWAPLQWVAVEGLRRHGEHTLAHEIAQRFIGEVGRVFRQEHKLVEKYDARGDGRGRGGEYALQDGFGWTNGVVRALLARYPDAGAARRDEADAAPAER